MTFLTQTNNSNCTVNCLPKMEKFDTKSSISKKAMFKKKVVIIFFEFSMLFLMPNPLRKWTRYLFSVESLIDRVYDVLCAAVLSATLV
jgi:hypothetical protein